MMRAADTTEDFTAWLLEQYRVTPDHLKLLDDGRYILASPLMFHWTMMIGRVGDTWGYDTRYCYTHEAVALTALALWNGEGDPVGWHRHPDTGRRRPDGDPAREYMEA